MTAPTPDAPVPLDDTHRLDSFDCGDDLLNAWLRRRARRNQTNGASRTYVSFADSRVVGFYALATGVLVATQATGRFRRNMPDPIPVALLARLAVDRRHQGCGLARALTRDALLRTISVSEIVGICGLIVHALDDAARDFYARIGFTPSPNDDLLLMITLADARAAVWG